MEGRAPVCKAIFTRISVTASHGLEAKNQTNKPSNLDADRTSLSGEGKESHDVKIMGYSLVMKKKGLEKHQGACLCEEKNHSHTE